MEIKMTNKELKEAIFDMFRKPKEAPKQQYKRIDSMLGGKMNLTAGDFAQLDPNSDPEKLKAAFETAYLRGNTDSRTSLKTLLDTAPYSEMKDMVAQIDAARGTANTNPNRQFGASNQPTVNRSDSGFLREHLRMIKLTNILSEVELNKCPIPTQNIELNLQNRQKAINEYGYGPLNPNEPNDKFWQAKADMWQLDSVEEAKTSLCGNCAAFDVTTKTLDCIAKGIGDDEGTEDPFDVIEAGKLGYCRMLKFKCAAARTCDAWVVGGPITDDKTV